MSTTSVLEFSLNRNGIAEQPFHSGIADDLPDIPALPETLFLMELKVRESSVDLRDISRLVLSDVGVTLQVFRMAARECGDGEYRPRRIEDCISTLGLEACLRAAAAAACGRSRLSTTVLELWSHSREMAEICKALAEEQICALNAEEAYLVGLLHAIGTIPWVLGWNVANSGLKGKAGTAVKLARQWSLPHCVEQYFGESQFPGYESSWTELIRVAHRKAIASPICIRSSGVSLLKSQRPF